MRTFYWVVAVIASFAIVHQVPWPNYFEQSRAAYWTALAIMVLGATLIIWTHEVVDRILNPKTGDSRGTFGLMMIVVFFVMAAVVFIGFATKWDGYNLGTLGDFMGGTLNPVLTFLTFIGLLFTIILQQKELHAANETKEKAEDSLAQEKRRASRQQFEYTFFQMLNLHNQIVSSLDLYISKPDTGSRDHDVKGRDCFKYFLENYYDRYRPHPETMDESERLNLAYEGFWERRQQDLSHYFRYLYNVLRFVSEYEDDVGDRFKYVKLLRAQLSNFELLLLFYTVLHKRGENYIKYIDEYELFDNLPYDHVLKPVHLKYYSPKSYGSQANVVMQYSHGAPVAEGDF